MKAKSLNPNMLRFSDNSIQKEGNKIVLCDLVSRLRFHPAVYEIRTGEIFRIDAINVDEEMFHVLDGEEYDWYNICYFKPVLYPMESVCSSYTADNIHKAASSIIRNIMNHSDIKFINQSLEFVSEGNAVMPLSFAMDILEVLNYRFIDYRNLINSDLAIDVNKLRRNPYKNKKDNYNG